MALDRDGSTIAYINTSNVITTLTAAQVAVLNNENADSYNINGSIVVIFPELRDLTGYFMQSNDTTRRGASGGWTSIQVSSDTTNGLDGTWTTIATNVLIGQAPLTIPDYRTSITTTSQTGIKAIKGYAYSSSDITTIHLYGNITAGQNPDRLVLWHPTLDQPLNGAYFDWGDVPQGTSASRTFRVKNLSSTKTANNVQLSLSALSNSNPTMTSQHALSSDGTNFAATASAGTLAPGATSGTMTLRRTISNSAALSLWALRISAVAASWT
jgi:hypothetical protein